MARAFTGRRGYGGPTGMDDPMSQVRGRWKVVRPRKLPPRGLNRRGHDTEEMPSMRPQPNGKPGFPDRTCHGAGKPSTSRCSRLSNPVHRCCTKRNHLAA
jgi:hypothetical protein